MATDDNQMFLVNRDLKAVDIRSLAAQPGRWAMLAEPGADDPKRDDRPLVSGSSQLKVGVAYPSNGRKGRSYYLPTFRLAIDDDGRPRVKLLFAAGGDEDDDVRRLTVDFTWSAPASPPGHDLRVMEHQVYPMLRYRLGVDGAAPTDKSTGTDQVVALQPIQITGDFTARSVTRFASKQAFEIVYHAMRTPSSRANLELNYSAPVWLRTFNQVTLGRASGTRLHGPLSRQDVQFANFVDATKVASLLATHATPAKPARPTTARPRPPVARPRPPEPGTAIPERMHRRPISPQMVHAVPMQLPSAMGAPWRSSASLMAGIPAARLAGLQAIPFDRLQSASAREKPWLTAHALRELTQPDMAITLAQSTQKIAGKKVVPVELAVDHKSRAALLDTTLKARHSLPFLFAPDRDEHAGVFEAPGMSGIHLLLPVALIDESSGTLMATVYQDNMLPDVVHVTPTRFRLVRDAPPLNSPSLKLVASDFSTEDGEVVFKVMMIYSLEPWFDPEVLQRAREVFAEQGLVPRFVANVSHDAALVLDRRSLDDRQHREDAEIEPQQGISDTLMLDEGEFIALWRDHFLGTGNGLTGSLSHRLIDGTPVKTEVRLSFNESYGEIVHVRFSGPVESAAGRYRVSLTNTIESPVIIDDLPVELLGADAVARPRALGTIAGRRLLPGESMDVEYQVTPANADVGVLRPLVLSRVEPDLPALLRTLMGNVGASSLGFSLLVRAVEGTFGSATGSVSDGTLIALKVEFDEGLEVLLDAARPEAEVTLTNRLVTMLMGEQDARERFFYRVSNVHTLGEGARTGWFEARGDEPLEIGHAVVNLD